jgi:hypothetical protein
MFQMRARRPAWVSLLAGLVLLQQGGCEFTGIMDGINSGVADTIDTLIQTGVLTFLFS